MTQALTRVFVMSANLRAMWSLEPFALRGAVRTKAALNCVKFPNFDRISTVCHG